MTATNVSNVDVHRPEFMPILGGVGPQAGARADMHIRMQYLSHAWWYEYWYPRFGGGGLVLRNYINSTSVDGYLIGTIIDVELNREAAYEWMGMPLTGDPAIWWAAHQFVYEDAWTSWVMNEGNSRLDIYCGYADRYYPEWTWSNMTVAPDGDILLTISHVSYGYEVLMTRWLTESELCVHQPMFEDFDLDAKYSNGTANVTFDAVAQYNFHAVKANGSTGNDGAWVWEPTRIDYWPSWSNQPAYHPSDYDPYAGPSWGGSRTYRSWDSGDPKFGMEVEYEHTPHRFNLTEFQTLIVKLPQGSNVPGYLGQGVGPNAIINMSDGDTHDYDALGYTGTASLGFVVSNPASPLDMGSVYDPITKTLTFSCPYNFNNPGGRGGGMLYHGAPWIEFNVSAVSSPPIADAGPDQSVFVGDLVTFDGSASWDDVQIVNYTWSFWYDGGPIQLYGVSPTFEFWITGVYNVTLTVRDDSNDTSSAFVRITVEVAIPEMPIVLVPVTGMLAVFLLAGISRRRERSKRG
jgi:hypothetical protein